MAKRKPERKLKPHQAAIVRRLRITSGMTVAGLARAFLVSVAEIRRALREA